MIVSELIEKLQELQEKNAEVWLEVEGDGVDYSDRAGGTDLDPTHNRLVITGELR